MPGYKRVLLKLSGEALMGEDAYGINPKTIDSMVTEIAQVLSLGVEIAIVIGGGNIFRGVAVFLAIQILGFIWFLIAPRYFPMAVFHDDEKHDELSIKPTN